MSWPAVRGEGAAAKPVVDVVLTVVDSADGSAYAPALEAAGYVLRIREPRWQEHRMFKGPDTEANLHVFGAGSAEVARVVAFRDRLRVLRAGWALWSGRGCG